MSTSHPFKADEAMHPLLLTDSDVAGELNIVPSTCFEVLKAFDRLEHLDKHHLFPLRDRLLLS